MSSIPLAALAVRPPEQDDTTGKLLQYLQVARQQQLLPGQLQQQQQTLQAGAQDLAARKALNDAYASATTKDASGNLAFDPDKLQSALATGPAAYKTPEVMEGLTKFQKTKVDLQNSIQDLQAKSTDMIGSAAAAVKAAGYDPTLAHSLIDSLPQSPQLNAFRSKIDGDPAVFKQMVDAAIAQSPKQAEAAKNLGQAAQSRYKVVNGALMDVSGPSPVPAIGQSMNPQDWLSLVDNVVPPQGANAGLNSRTKQQVSFYVKNGNLEAAQKAITEAGQQVGAIEKETNPDVQAGKVKVAAAEGAARANIEAQVARGSNAALAQVPPHLVQPATAAATKAGEDYAQAQSVTQRLNAMMDAAKKGNVVSYQLIPQEGALQLTTSQGVHRINMAEIQNYGGGSLWQRMEGHIGKQLTGKSIPDSVLNDMADMQKIQQEGAQTKYENTLKTINQNYGSTFQPVKIETATPKNASGPPAGATHTARGSDGKIHWTDSTGTKDLGVKE